MPPAETVFQFRQSPTIPPSLLADVLAKLAYLDERVAEASVSVGGDVITVSLHGEADAELEGILGERVRTIVAAMTKGTFEPPLRVLEEHTFTMTAAGDPMLDLLARGELVQEGPGFFVIGPLLSRVIAYFERRMMDVANDMGAAPYRFPALISPSYMEQVQYFRSFPHALTFATHLRENLPGIQQFSCEAVTQDGRIIVDGDLYARVPAVLAPTICHHLYLALRGTRLSEGMIATASGHCFRYESRNMKSLERLWNFTMREIIFVGSAEHVRNSLADARERIRPIMEEFQLTHKIMSANDPFFIGTFRDQAAFQAAFELKYEIRAALPYKEDTLAVGSYNRHNDFFGRTLDIRLQDGSAAHTGCIGIGFERLAHAFVAQHGTDPQKWPRTVQDAVR
jgi:seryl-tRNA synthetase